jgi:hypothetical protein
MSSNGSARELPGDQLVVPCLELVAAADWTCRARVG